jgi:hemolysin activation/secretion protein
VESGIRATEQQGSTGTWFAGSGTGGFARETSGRMRRVVFRLVMVLGGLLSAGAATPQTPPAATPGGAFPLLPGDIAEPRERADPGFPIPPAVERPLDVDDGDRLFVERFDLLGVTPRPDRGIDPEELGTLVERLRQERQSLDRVGADGFTDEERNELATFMQAVVADPGGDPRVEEYQALVASLRASRAERDAGMTIGQMQEIAATVTDYYRSAGFILAQAHIPAQEVENGVVAIEVLEGTLERVVAEGEERYSREVLARSFRGLVDEPVTAADIERAVLLASDYPGLTLFGIFQPGRQVGGTEMLLRVQEEKPFNATLRVDNHGTRFTGELRTFGEFAWNNPTRAGDRLTLTALRQFRPSNAWFGQVAYERPIGLPGLSVGLSAQRNPFDVGGELRDARLAGESEALRVHSRYTLFRSRNRNAYAYLGWRRADSATLQDSRMVSLDRISALEAELTYDSIDAAARAINLATVGVTVGLGDRLGGVGRERAARQRVPPGRQAESGTFASNDFFRINAAYSRLQKLTDHQSLLVRLEAQHSPSLLASLEQFSLGGPATVRAYPVSERLADTALFASAEWSVSAPGFADRPFSESLSWGEVLRLSVFGDFAIGRINRPTADDDTPFAIGGVGTAISFSLPGQLQSRLQWAQPIGARRASDDKSGRVWFDLSYQF